MNKSFIYPFIFLFFSIGLISFSADIKPQSRFVDVGDTIDLFFTVGLPKDRNQMERMISQEAANLFDCESVIDVDPDDCKVLVRVYESTNGAGWTNNFNWLWSPIVDFWYGVTVDKYHVIGLDLGSNELDGTIPADIGNLTSLRTLALSFNNLTGTIPTELGNLDNLERLYLNFNDFQGSLTAGLGNLSNLEQLYLFANPSLCGPIPQNYINLTALERFWFYDTGLCEPSNPEFQAWKAQVSDWMGTVDCIYCYLPFILH